MTCSHNHNCGCGSLSNANIKAVIEGLLTTALDEKDFDALELKHSIYQNLLKIGDIQDKLNDFKADMALNLSALLTKTELASIKAELENLILNQQNIYEDLQRDFEAVTSQKLLDYKTDVQDIQNEVEDQLNTVQNQIASLVPTRDAYKIAVQNGYVGSEASWLDSLKGHSAYTLAKAHGFKGSEAEWLTSLKGDRGAKGDKGDQGFAGKDGINGSNGIDGISAYEVARKNGYVGSESAWLNTLIGEKGERGVGLAHVNHNNDDTLTFLFTDNTSYTSRSIRGEQGIQGPEAKSVYDIAVSHGFRGNEEDWLSYILENSETVTDLFADADSLERFINGSEEETVLTRLSAEYPTLQKAIKQLFENGGLPATPFATKALMTASALVDGDYALVTEDTPVNNGLYIKQGGEWTKSEYDPTSLERARLAAIKEEVVLNSNKVLAQNKLSKFEYINITPELAGYYRHTGEYVEDAALVTSQKIKVTKGDCFVLQDISTSNTPFVFNLFDDADTFIGTVDYSQLSTTPYGEHGQYLYGLGRQNSDLNYRSSGVVIPLDGYLRVTVVTDSRLDTLHPNGNKPLQTLIKCGYEHFNKYTLSPFDLEVMRAFEGALYSPILDKTFTQGTHIIPANQVIGSTLITTAGSASYKHSISKKYAVKKGQYVHCVARKGTSNNSPINFLDAFGNTYVGSADIFNEYTVGAIETPNATVNIPVPEDGFVVFAAGSTTTMPTLVGITDGKISLPNRLLRDSVDRIDFPKTTAFWINLTTNYLNGANYSNHVVYNKLNDDYQLEVSKPYRLSKGEVLEYTLQATSYPLMALVFPADTVLKNAKVINAPSSILPLYATEVFTKDEEVAWTKDGRISNKDVLPQAKKGVVSYCNEDSDVIVVLLRPHLNSPNYIAFKQSTEYKVEILTKNAYIAKRNEELEERFKVVTSAHIPANKTQIALVDAKYQGKGTYPPVLLFKGEVLSCLTNAKGRVSARGLTNLKTIEVSPTPFVKGDLVSDLGELVYPTGNDIIYANYSNMIIEADNPNSFFRTQVYAHQTCLVYAPINVYNADITTTLDPDGLIASGFAKPVIEDINDIGELTKIESMFVPGLNMFKQGNEAPITVRHLGTQDLLVTFAPKGSVILGEYWGRSTLHNIFVAGLENHDALGIPWGSLEPQLFRDKKGVFTILDFIEDCQNKMAHVLTEDSLVVVNSSRKAIVTDVSAATKEEILDVVDPARNKIMEKYRHSLSFISQGEYTRDYKITDETFLNFPITNELTFNFCTSTSTYLETDLWGVAQIKYGDKVAATFNVKTANQGQSTAALSRKNVDIGFHNSKFEKVAVKFGEYPEETKLVMKSYLRSDRCQFREATSTSLWHDIRTVNPFPEDSVIPKSVFDDVSNPSNQVARGTPFVVPFTVQRGDTFTQIGSIRNKKSNENYAMDEDNREQILMQVESGFNWSTLNLTMFEVRSPDVPGYTVKDPSMPAGYEDVDLKLQTILEWMRGVFNGTVDFRSTYEDHIHLESWVDYIISTRVCHHWDGYRNNYLLGDYGDGKWRIFWYDSDQTFSVSSPFTEDTNHLFHKISQAIPEIIEERYRELRDKGVISAEAIQGKMTKNYKMLNSYARKLDTYYWTEVPPLSTYPFAMNWIYKRLGMLDLSYNYLDTNVVSLTYYRLSSSLGSLAERVVTVTAPTVKVGEELYVDYAYTFDNLKVTAECLEDGLVVVTFKNTGTESIAATSTGYLRVKRKYSLDRINK